MIFTEVEIMCGRFARKSGPIKLAKELGMAEAQVEPSYNVAPTHSILATQPGRQ